ncbi:MAG: PP2C family protein-serine/threonine phosphatase [Eisenbergiella sp.]
MAYIASWYWDKGRFREKNEDSFSLQRVMRNGTELVFLAVCDGIGGLPEGECASGFAAERLTEWFYREAGACMEGIFWRRRMKKLVRKAFFDIQSGLERCEREEDICCGTTCTMALVKNGRFLLAHMGDSRAYRIGAGRCV